MVQVWKIAPGVGAEDWELFREHGCIGLGWRLPDYRRYDSQEAVLRALEAKYGKGKKGFGSGAAKIIRRFVAEVKPQHIVVANQGNRRVVGVGVITSDYLPPTSKQNPIRATTKTHRRHVRLVDWLITKPLTISQRQFFVQASLGPMKKEKFDRIRKAYEAKYPDLQLLFSQLVGGYLSGVSGLLPEEVVEVSTLLEGAVRQITVNAYERNRVARTKCIAAHGTNCCICGFSFGKAYGSDAEGYIHVHHIRPISNACGEYKVNPIEDLRPVCPNCHAVLHMGGEHRSIECVKKLLTSRASSATRRR